MNDNNNNILIPKLKLDNLNYKNMQYNSLIKKKLALLEQLEKEEEEKVNNKGSKIIHYKNTIPNNFKKNKTYRKEKKKSMIDNKNKNINNTNFDLTSYYPSPISQKELNDNFIIRNYSHQNSEIINSEKSKTNSYYAQGKNNLSINKNTINLSPSNNSNNHYISKTGTPTSVLVENRPKKNKKKSNSYKFLPKNICSMAFEGIKNKININSKRKQIYTSLNGNKGKNRISYASINKNMPFNSLGLIDNSISTNFIERPSLNENTISAVNDNNQYSSLYNKVNKNGSYTFPSKEISTSPNDEKLKNENRIYFKKINNHFKKNKNQKRIYNRIIIENNFDNITSNTINTDSSSKNPKIKNNDNLKEKLDDFKIINELMGDKKNNLDNLKITSGEVNENVNNRRNKQDEKSTHMSQKSEPMTIQSMSDSKILEIANYYLNEEEIVDKIEIDDILSTKNNKSNYNLKDN